MSGNLSIIVAAASLFSLSLAVSHTLSLCVCVCMCSFHLFAPLPPILFTVVGDGFTNECFPEMDRPHASLGICTSIHPLIHPLGWVLISPFGLDCDGLTLPPDLTDIWCGPKIAWSTSGLGLLGPDQASSLFLDV